LTFNLMSGLCSTNSSTQSFSLCLGALVSSHPHLAMVKYAGPIARGLRKGHPVTKRKQVIHSHHNPRRVNLVKDVITEVAGFAPYERRIMELLKNSLDKRALKMAKKRLGTHKRAKAKREALSAAIRRAKAAH